MAAVSLSEPATPNKTVVFACMLAGMCTFLNVYDTQPLLPYLRRVFHASEIMVSLTVSATVLAVALLAPFVGLMAESVGRKKVIVPSLYLLSGPTLLAATSHNLGQLIFWRFMQGLFVPGVIVVMMAYINEEFGREQVGRAMSAYVSGTVLGGFLGRYITGVIANHLNWQKAFVAIGILNLAGAAIVQRSLPLARKFARAESVRHSLREALHHLRNPLLLAVYGMGFAALFSIVGAFTYTNFHLAAAPYHLNSQQLGSIFFVYLLGFFVTPLAGRLLDRFGIRAAASLAAALSLVGLLITLASPLSVIILGLAIFASGVFIFQAVGTVQTGIVAGRSRSSAAGFYVTFYYVGGSLGAIVTGWTWVAGGWPACVWLLMAVSALALVLGFLSTIAEKSRKLIQDGR